MSRRRSLLKALTVLSKNFDKELDEDSLSIYEQVLKDLDEGQIHRMLQTALTSMAEYMPRAGQLLNMGLRGDRTPYSEGLFEWSFLVRALHDDQTRQLRPRTRRVALSFGTFSQLQAMPWREFDFLRRDFAKRYAEDCSMTDGHEDQPVLEKQKPTEQVPFIRPQMKCMDSY